MELFSFLKRRQPEPAKSNRAPNPHTNSAIRSAGFFSSDVDRLLSGWDTHSKTIDHYLQVELRQIRARSRRMVRMNPFGKKFVQTLRANVVGPVGVTVQAQTMRGNEMDNAANQAIEDAFKVWGRRHCDLLGRSTWDDFQNMAISCAGQDGEFLFRKHNTGPHGFQLQSIDAEYLDVEKNEPTRSGGTIRLGVEYDKIGRRVNYHFRNPDNGNKWVVRAADIIHGFIGEWPDQSRGIPWMAASLERTKHLEKYEEAAIIKARSTASTMAVLKSEPGQGFTGDEQTEDPGVTLQEYEPGTIQDIGQRDIVNIDSDYPHEMYGAFVKTQLQSIASGLGISYASLSSDLEGVNYSSIRAGVLEDREIFKGLQNWFIRDLVEPVYEQWVLSAASRNVITINGRPLSKPIIEYLPAHFQGRRWSWVDPQKDATAQQMAIASDLKSRSQIIRELGDDPETVWREIQRERELMKTLGIEPAVFNNEQQQKPESVSDDGED